MRFKLPTENQARKIAYTGLELLLLVIPTWMAAPFPPHPFLSLVVIIRSFQMFSFLGCLVVSGLTFGCFFVVGIFHNPIDGLLLKSILETQGLPSQEVVSTLIKVNGASSFAVAIMFVLLLINTLLEESRSREQLEVAHAQLHQYALRIENQSALQERNRIAREIHDSLGHTLTAQSIQLDSALLLLHSDSTQTDQFLSEAKHLCSQALREVRHSVSALRTDPLQGKSLQTAVSGLLEDFQATTAIEPRCTIQVQEGLPSDIWSALYRILQEALTNITRHSRASEVIIQLLQNPNSLQLLVRDNGRGYDPAQNSTGFGVQCMRERTMALGGRFNLVSQPGSGCLVTVQIPIVKRPA
ncbi:MAG: sensor histidine kinase [Cyanobacteria bacterium P01_A01_bin.17]